MARPIYQEPLLKMADFICSSFETNEQFPTLREIARGTGYSLYAIYYRILQLEKQGYLKRGANGRITNARRELTHFWLIQLVNRNQHSQD